MTGKATEKDPALKFARHRLSGVEAAKGIVNVTETCCGGSTTCTPISGFN